MLEILFYILYKGWKIENPRFDLRNFYRLQIFFTAQQSIILIVILLIIIDKQNLIQPLNNLFSICNCIKEIRLFVILFSIIVISAYNYFFIFKKNKRHIIFNKYDGKFFTLIKYSSMISFFLIIIPFLLLLIFRYK